MRPSRGSVAGAGRIALKPANLRRNSDIQKLKKLKIGVIGVKGLPGHGGAARTCGEIFSRIKKDFDIAVYALNSHVSEEDVEGIEQIVFKKSRMHKYADVLYYFKAAFHALFLRTYDVIHLNHHIAGFLVPMLRIRYRVLFHIHGLPYKHDDKWNRFDKRLIGSFFKIGCRFASEVITVQKSSVPELQRYSRCQVRYIPNGVNDLITQFGDGGGRRFDITFSAARIIYLKGLHTLMEALHMISFGGSVQIIGDLDHVPEYKNRIRDLSNGLDVIFTGLITSEEQLFKAIGSSKLFVFPSYSEGMSNMLLEVAALNVPLIASDITQNTDVFSRDEVLFFSTGNAADLAEKITWARTHYPAMQKLSLAARRKVKNEHDWNEIAGRYSAIYGQMR